MAIVIVMENVIAATDMTLASMVREWYSSRRLVYSLAVSDFRNRFVGSYYGIVWEILQPLSLIFIFWFVFEVALGFTSIDGEPWSLWLVIGLTPWFFFSDAWSNCTNAFTQYSFLVKKMVFKVEILPIIKVVSSMLTSIIFHVILILFLIIYGEGGRLSSLGILYYMFCTIMLVTGLGFITSSVVVFFKDMRQLLTIILQFGIYLTPILWPVDRIPESMHWIVTINPMAYIVDGYRSCIFGEPCLDIWATMIFWSMTVALLIIGSIVFHRLKPHLADVL